MEGDIDKIKPQENKDMLIEQYCECRLNFEIYKLLSQGKESYEIKEDLQKAKEKLLATGISENFTGIFLRFLKRKVDEIGEELENSFKRYIKNKEEASRGQKIVLGPSRKKELAEAFFSKDINKKHVIKIAQKYEIPIEFINILK